MNIKFLADENFPFDAVHALRTAGYDVTWIRADAPGSTDRQVLATAANEQRTLLTFDKDFGELAFRSRLPVMCGVVLFRVPMSSARIIAQQVLVAIQSRSDWVGHFSVVEERRIRVRSLP